MDASAIIVTLRRHQPELNAAGLLHLRLFGSAARGDNTPQSDVDLIAEFDPSKPLTLLTLSRHQYRLTDLLQAEVDLSSSEWMYTRVRAEALRDAIDAF